MKALIIFSLITIFSIGCFGQNQRAESFNVESLEGKHFNSEELQGKVVVLYFWSTSCPICENITPKLNLIADKYADKNVVYLAVTHERKNKVEPFLKKHKLAFDVIAGNFDIIFKYGDKGKDGDFNMPFPSLFIIDSSGGLALKSVGIKAAVEVDNTLSKLTNQ